MKTPLGTEVDLGPVHIVLDDTQLPRERHSSPPLFGPCLFGYGRPSQLLLSCCIRTLMREEYGYEVTAY